MCVIICFLVKICHRVTLQTSTTQYTNNLLSFQGIMFNDNQANFLLLANNSRDSAASDHDFTNNDDDIVATQTHLIYVVGAIGLFFIGLFLLINVCPPFCRRTRQVRWLLKRKEVREEKQNRTIVGAE